MYILGFVSTTYFINSRFSMEHLNIAVLVNSSCSFFYANMSYANMVVFVEQITYVPISQFNKFQFIHEKLMYAPNRHTTSFQHL